MIGVDAASFHPLLRGLARVGVLAGLLAGAIDPAAAWAKDNSATRALAEFRGKKAPTGVIQNKFFLKANRFEVAPMLGYVPSNAFIDNYVGGAALAYHFSEELAAEGNFFINPFPADTGVKNLTKTLLDIANEGGEDAASFQQPLDSLFYSAIFSARYSPVYGKINLVGHSVVNFDVYGTLGIGLVGITKNIATVSQEYKDGKEGADPVALQADPDIENNFAVNLGVGFDFFLSQSVALKLDARSFLYVGLEPDYGNTLENGQPRPLERELYATFITTGGVSIFVPKMKPRVFNF